jgi:hypothetical protein
MKKNKSKNSDKELQELGQKLREVIEVGYVNRKQALWFSFLKGMATGFGAFLGGTILIGLLLGLLSLFTEIPLIGQVIENFRNSLDK